jgi:hypothetical protein
VQQALPTSLLVKGWIGLDPCKMFYLNEAGRFLGNLDARRIQHRGEAPSRYTATFDVVDHLKNIRIEQT